MPFRFRRSKKIGPFRFTMSGSGLSASVGSGPFRYTFNSNGGRTRTMRTGIPGLRYEERDTPNSPASARSAGSRSPIPKSPASIRFRSTVASCEASRPPSAGDVASCSIRGSYRSASRPAPG